MALGTDCVSRLGLSRTPFGPEPAEGPFLFREAGLEPNLKSLNQLVYSGVYLGLIKGPSGIGKTTLLTTLSQRLAGAREIRLATITAQSNQDPIAQASEAFGSPDPLEEHLRGLHAAGVTPVLAVDDAHCLSRDGLISLIDLSLPFAVGEKSLVNMLLFADPSIDDLLLSLSAEILPPARIYLLNLHRLTQEQCSAYVEHRLRAAGLRGRVPLKRQDLALIKRQANGLPGEVNRLANAQLERLCDKLYSRRIRGFRKALENPLWMAGLGVLALAVVLAWPTLQTLAPSSSTAPSERPTDPGRDARGPAETAPVREADPDNATTTRQSPPAILIRRAARPPPAPATEPAAEAGPGTEPGEEAETSDELLDRGWLASQDPEHLVIQILGGRDLERVRTVARRVGFEKPSFFRSRYAGEDWYVAILGPFADLQTARRILADLSPAQSRYRPFVRTVGSLDGMFLDPLPPPPPEAAQAADAEPGAAVAGNP